VPAILERENAQAALDAGACWCGRDLEDHEVPCVEVPYPAAMLAFPRVRQSDLSEFWQCHLLRRFKLLHERDVHSAPQSRGSHFHRWAARLLSLLEVIGQDHLRDEPECPNPQCQAKPNDLLERADDGTLFNAETGDVVSGPYQVGQLCPVCEQEPLVEVALEDQAIELLIEVLRQRDVPDEDRLPLPYGEHLKDLEWIVRKFAREQTFNIANLIDVEERLSAPIHYPNPYGGVVERVFSGQMDVVFMGPTPDHLVVLDWKDTWAIPGPGSISSEGYFQQRAYAYLILMQPENEHVEKVTLREVYVRFGPGESGMDNVREATITRKRLPMIARELGMIVEAYDEALQHGEERPKLWRNPTEGGHCNYCPRPHDCPVWAGDMRDLAPPQTMEEAEQAAGLLTVAKRVAKLMEGRVKGFVAKPGPRPAVPVRVDTGQTGKGGDPDALTVFKDKRPGLPEGVPIRTAKGRKVYAYVEGKRTSSPTAEQVQEALEARAKGIPVDASDLFKTGASTTFRLVEEAVPTDPLDERLRDAVRGEDAA
jgi:hypothetical protein